MDLQDKVNDIIKEQPIEEKAALLCIIDDAAGIIDELDDTTAGKYADVIKLILENYSSKKPCDFNAGGAGLDLLRIKMFAERSGFTVDVESTRCQYIPLDTDQCPGKISDCNHIKDRSGCLSSGGSTFTITFSKN
ncbi:MAG: hypothetical protein P8185_21135 [Deltaproteobacteria bacterium]